MLRKLTLAIIEAMLWILAAFPAEAGARFAHVPAWARGRAIGFHRLTTLLLLPVAGEDRCRRFVNRRTAPPHSPAPG